MNRLLHAMIATALTIVAVTSSVHAAADDVFIIVDPRIELLSVVQYLSDYTGFDGPVLTKLDFPYKQEAIEYFTPYKDHPAVKLFDEMSAAGFWYGQPPEAMLSYSNPPELKEVRPLSDFIVQRAGGKQKLDAFIAAMRDFAAETDFMSWFDAHRADYDKMIADYRRSAGEWEYMDDLVDFYGFRQHSYTVVVAPFFHAGGFGPRIEAGNGRYDVYNLGGPWSYENDVFSFGDGQYFQRLVWHEFSHSYVNHLADLYIDRLTVPADILQPGMKKQIEGMPGVTWELFAHEWVSEHIVRAVTTYLAYTKLGDAEGEIALRKENDQGYDYVKPLCDRLKVYEANRDRYPDFTSFFPELIEVFERLAEQAEN